MHVKSLYFNFEEDIHKIALKIYIIEIIIPLLSWLVFVICGNTYILVCKIFLALTTHWIWVQNQMFSKKDKLSRLFVRQSKQSTN